MDELSPIRYVHYSLGILLDWYLSVVDKYNQVVATHYAAYRPAIHSIILSKVLTQEDYFEVGLDVGCGTGYSAIALTKYCHHVYGLEPSQSMLAEVISQERITYLKGHGSAIPLKEGSVNIVTFAGSLFYAKSDALINELKRVCLGNALIVCYDFEVLLDEVMRQYGIVRPSAESSYDHAVNFSGIHALKEIIVGYDRLTVHVTAAQLTHVLLSDAYRYESFAEQYGTQNPYQSLLDEIESKNQSSYLTVNTYYAKYTIKA